MSWLIFQLVPLIEMAGRKWPEHGRKNAIGGDARTRRLLMLPLRAALILILAGSASSALAEQITCESRQSGAEPCGTVAAGSSVRLIRQLSDTACVAGRNWGTGPDHDSIWVSGGCRAVFDVQPPYNSSAVDIPPQAQNQNPRDDDRGNGTYEERPVNPPPAYRDDRAQDRDRYAEAPYPAGPGDESRQYAAPPPRADERYQGRRYASVDQLRRGAGRACAEQAAAGQAYAPDQVEVSDVRWVGHGMFDVSLATPAGPLSCMVDRNGNVRSIDER
jgi:hypothetical protein